MEAGEVRSCDLISSCAIRNMRVQNRNERAPAAQWFPRFPTKLFSIASCIIISSWVFLSMLALFIVSCKNIMELDRKKPIYGIFLNTDLMST